MKSIEAFIAFWGKHGTKALGGAATFFAGLQAAIAVMGNVFTPKTVAIVAGVNAALGIWTVKRGFSNSRAQDDAEPTPDSGS
jgi:hypothetical protein